MVHEFVKPIVRIWLKTTKKLLEMGIDTCEELLKLLEEKKQKTG